MATEVRHRRGTTVQHAGFTGAQGEVTVDTDKKVTVVHDGVTPGGFPGTSAASSASKAEIVDVQRSAFNTSVAGGTVNAIALTLSPAITALANGMQFEFKPLGANTIVGVTVAVNGLPAKALVKRDNIALVVDDIDGVGHRAIIVYDATIDKFVLTNPKFGEIPDGYLTADVAGRAKMADGFVDYLKIAPGAVVQVVTISSAGGSTSSGTYGNVTSLSITPKAATNKILILMHWQANSAAFAGVNAVHQAQVLRNAVLVSGNLTGGSDTGAGGVGWSGQGNFIKLDSPSTTASITYFLQHRTTNTSSLATTSNVEITLMEIKG